MVYNVSEMTVKKSYKYGEYGSFEHLFFLVVKATSPELPDLCAFPLLVLCSCRLDQSSRQGLTWARINFCCKQMLW